jgi:hypothetical protein
MELLTKNPLQQNYKNDEKIRAFMLLTRYSIIFAFIGANFFYDFMVDGCSDGDNRKLWCDLLIGCFLGVV